MTTNTTREGFEKWAISKSLSVQRHGDGYYVLATDDRWEGYQAAKADELAFLEGLRPLIYKGSLGRSMIEIDDRIAELKGKK